MQIVSILDFVFLFFMIGLTLYGYTMGLIMQAAKLIELATSCLCAEIIARLLSKAVGQNVSYQFLKHIPWAEGVTSKMVEEFAESFSHGVIFIVLFIVLHLVLRKVIELLDIVDKIPVVGFLDSFGGGIFGFLQSFLWIYVIGSLLLALVPQHILEGWGFTEDAMRHSMYFKMLL